MTVKKNICLFSAIVVFACAPVLHAEDSPEKEHAGVIAISDLELQHDGKEVTVVLKVTDTQLIAGDREGMFPNVRLWHEGMKKPPHLGVTAKGGLADTLHRFALVAPDDRFVGRTIKASGTIKIYNKEDKKPVYVLNLRDPKKFQILPEQKGE